MQQTQNSEIFTDEAYIQTHVDRQRRQLPPSALFAQDLAVEAFVASGHRPHVNAVLAIYDALLQAKVSPDAARAVADALEKDMNHLATKQDLVQLRELLTRDIQLATSELSQKLTVRMGLMFSATIAILSGLLALLR